MYTHSQVGRNDDYGGENITTRMATTLLMLNHYVGKVVFLCVIFFTFLLVFSFRARFVCAASVRVLVAGPAPAPVSICDYSSVGGELPHSLRHCHGRRRLAHPRDLLLTAARGSISPAWSRHPGRTQLLLHRTSGVEDVAYSLFGRAAGPSQRPHSFTLCFGNRRFVSFFFFARLFLPPHSLLNNRNGKVRSQGLSFGLYSISLRFQHTFFPYSPLAFVAANVLIN
jgi:hypothetical protein